MRARLGQRQHATLTWRAANGTRARQTAWRAA